MPTYEYECADCKDTFEIFQSMKDASLSVCPKCGGKVRRLINGGAGIIFKGAGFYTTDKRRANTAATAKPKEEAASSAANTASANAPCASCPASNDGAPCAAAHGSSSRTAEKPAGKPEEKKAS